MKKLVLVAALFMFVCGGSFVANAQDPVKTQQQQPATEKLKSLKPLSLPRKNPKQKNRKLKSPKLKLLPTVLLQRKHLHSLLNNSKHTDNKSRPLLVYSGGWLLSFSDTRTSSYYNNGSNQQAQNT